MNAGQAYVAQRKREAASGLLAVGYVFATAHMKTKPFQKTMRGFLVKLSADDVLTVCCKHTGEVLASSVPGMPTKLRDDFK